MTDMAGPVAIVQGQVDAYNSHNLAVFCTFFDDNVTVSLLGREDTIIVGKKVFEKRYAKRFADSPSLHCTITARIAQGSFVIDHESISGVNDEVRQVVAIYEINAQRLIQNVWFIEG
jgi:hypothetical protein